MEVLIETHDPCKQDQANTLFVIKMILNSGDEQLIKSPDILGGKETIKMLIAIAIDSGKSDAELKEFISVLGNLCAEYDQQAVFNETIRNLSQSIIEDLPKPDSNYSQLESIQSKITADSSIDELAEMMGSMLSMIPRATIIRIKTSVVHKMRGGDYYLSKFLFGQTRTDQFMAVLANHKLPSIASDPPKEHLFVQLEDAHVQNAEPKIGKMGNAGDSKTEFVSTKPDPVTPEVINEWLKTLQEISSSPFPTGLDMPSDPAAGVKGPTTELEAQPGGLKATPTTYHAEPFLFLPFPTEVATAILEKVSEFSRELESTGSGLESAVLEDSVDVPTADPDGSEPVDESVPVGRDSFNICKELYKRILVSTF